MATLPGTRPDGSSGLADVGGAEVGGWLSQDTEVIEMEGVTPHGIVV
ncbi:MAG: hypothetical protein GWQ05_11615 [Verrucomicrobiaceae bacterium]|nr:hypothetical protein [Verrucomicrobiaceae bacterium]